MRRRRARGRSPAARRCASDRGPCSAPSALPTPLLSPFPLRGRKRHSLMIPGREVKQAESHTGVRFSGLGTLPENAMTPVTLARFMKELEKLKKESDGGVKPDEYDTRLARVIQELRDRGLDADRAATTAAPADAGKGGVNPPAGQGALQRGVGAGQAAWKY